MALAVLGVQGDPHAGLDAQREAAGRERLIECAVDPRGGRGDRLCRGHVGQQHRELVAAEACDGVSVADDRAQTLADALDHDIAVEVAERVVDLLEAIEVHHEHGDHPLAVARGQCLLEQAVEQRTVGQAGQRVLERLTLVLIGLVAHPRGGARGRADETGSERQEADEQDQQPARVGRRRGTDRLVREVDGECPGGRRGAVGAEGNHCLDRRLPVRRAHPGGRGARERASDVVGGGGLEGPGGGARPAGSETGSSCPGGRSAAQP
jgi:hypothetical protein